MKDYEGREMPVHARHYAKRLDLRLVELPDTSNTEELADWKWWINELELYKECQDLPLQERINALSLPLYQHIHGTPDPAKIIALFCLCQEMRVYPPAWIMNELYSRFDEYLKDNITGKKKRRLGEYFGEPARGNRSAAFRQQAFKHVMQSALAAVDRLRYHFNLSKEQALCLVAQRLETVENDTCHRFEKGEAALEKAYRDWCKMDSRQEHIEWLKTLTFSDEDTLEFLHSFPPDSFTGIPHIEKRLKKS
jgi:hypothetical protein